MCLQHFFVKLREHTKKQCFGLDLRGNKVNGHIFVLLYCIILMRDDITQHYINPLRSRIYFLILEFFSFIVIKVDELNRVNAIGW